MNARRLAWLLPWLVVGSLWGQVTVSVILDQQQFLPGEAVPVKVRLVNHSGQTLSFGEDNSWLRISVEADDSFVVSRIGEVPVAGAFVVPPSKMATKQLDIEPYFAVTRPGRYSVIATVMVKEWGQTLASDPVSFDVITGTVLWEKVFGLPQSRQPDGAPEARKYLLQQANNVRSQIQLYARITDVAEQQTFGVVSIGPMVSFSRPAALVDGESNLHVLYQSGPRVSTYCKVDPDGRTLIREKLEYSGSRPRLSAADDGTIGVIGGVRLPQRPDSAPPQDSEDQDHDQG